MNKYSAIIKRVIKSVTPPIILKSLVKLYQMLNSNNISWKGNYPDWQSAQADARGYATDDIFIKTREAARAVRDGKALWERDSVLFYHEEYNFPLVAALMTVAAMNNGRLRVLDYGGSFGSTFYQHKSLFQNIDVSWNIVEQKHIVVSGIEEFKTNQIHFWADIQSCAAAVPLNLILFSSVLQYIDTPYSMLEQAINLRPSAIVIDRTPFYECSERITVQYVPKSIYSASYPCRFLNKARVISLLQDAYHCLPPYSSNIDPYGFLEIIALKRGQNVTVS